jgi:hypothetical protein
MQNQHLANAIMYQVKYPFSQYACCTCKWALQGNKHQIVVIITYNDVTHEDIIEYYGTWYGSIHGGLAPMFVYP